MKYKILIISVMAFMAACMFIALTSASPTPRKQAKASCPPDTINLNYTLTNEMSACSDSLRGMETMIREFLRKWEIRGASLSIMRNDSLVYSKGFGWADKEARARMTPGNILRMASVSKLITATAIMVLQERKRLSLSDHVFGRKGILCDQDFTDAIIDSRIFDITIEDLLRHRAGFISIPYDPMFSTPAVMKEFHLSEVPDPHTLAKCILSKALYFNPGTDNAYSNFGYLILSLVIEKVSGVGYEEFVQKNVLNPAGCHDMHIANTYYSQKYPNEVKYYMQKGASLREEYNRSGRMVEKCYGGSNIPALLGAGAWCGSTAELCRFVASIDGRPEIPDIISQKSVARMTEYLGPDSFGLGWNNTNPESGWIRTGTLSGSAALIKYYPDGECWILITNTGTYRGPRFSKYVSFLFYRCRERYSKFLPQQNLFWGNREDC